MVQSFFRSITVAACLVSFASTSNAVIIAEYDPGSPNYSAAVEIGNPSFVRGQSFTATIDADASFVEVFVMRIDFATTTEDLLVDVREGTLLSNPVLASGTIPYSSVPAGNPFAPGDLTNAAFLGTTLSTSVSVLSGTEYSIWLTTAGTTGLYGWWGNASNPYSAGSALTNSLPLSDMFGDLGFRVTPEPSTVALAAFGFAALAAFGWRRRKRA